MTLEIQTSANIFYEGLGYSNREKGNWRDFNQEKRWVSLESLQEHLKKEIGEWNELPLKSQEEMNKDSEYYSGRQDGLKELLEELGFGGKKQWL